MSCIFDREKEELHCFSSWEVKLSISWGHHFGQSAMIGKSWVQYSIFLCTVQLPVLTGEGEGLTPYCLQNNVLWFCLRFPFSRTWPDLFCTFSCKLFVIYICTYFLTQLLFACISTAVNVFHCAVSGRKTFLIKHIPHLYVFVLNGSIKVPCPWNTAACTHLGTSVAPAAPRLAPPGWSPSCETWFVTA